MNPIRYSIIVLVAAVLFGGRVAGEQITDTDAVVQLKCQVTLAASEPGIVSTVHVTEGDSVKQDAPIMSLDDAKIRREAQAASQEAEIALLASENDVDARFAAKSQAVAKSELQRAMQAVKMFAKSVSKSELEQLRLQSERSELAEEQAERDLEQAALRALLEQARAEISAVRMKDMKIKAPFDGVVVEVLKHAGEWVSLGEPIARVIQLDHLRVEAVVNARDVDSTQLQGQPASITVDMPGGTEETFTGKVTFVSPEIDPDSGLTFVWAEIDNPEKRLRPGMRGELKIGE
jgi:multidrug resistance efflux pump